MLSIILNETTVDSVISALLRKIKRYVDNLCKFTQSYLKEWNRIRRKCMVYAKFNSSCKNSEFLQELSEQKYNLNL